MSKQKGVFKYVFLVFAVVIIIADVCLILMHEKPFSENENRMLQQAPEFSYIRQMLQQYRWQEAQQALESMENRSAEWYYLYARVRQGLGDDIAALNFAHNLEYV